MSARDSLGADEPLVDATARVYPISPRPLHDSRFTVGLILAVGRVLSEHGYPDPVGNGRDYVALMEALFGFLYDSTTPPSVDVV